MSDLPTIEESKAKIRSIMSDTINIDTQLSTIQLQPEDILLVQVNTTNMTKTKAEQLMVELKDHAKLAMIDKTNHVIVYPQHVEIQSLSLKPKDTILVTVKMGNMPKSMQDAYMLRLYTDLALVYPDNHVMVVPDNITVTIEPEGEVDG